MLASLRLRAKRILLACLAMSCATAAHGQNLGGAFGQIVGGMIAAGQASAAREQWGRTSPDDRSCADAVLRRAGSSLERLMGAGVMPDDGRISSLWTICRQVNRTMRQNYSCSITIGGRTWQSFCNEELVLASNTQQKLSREQAIDALARNQGVAVTGFERMDAQFRREEMAKVQPGATEVNAPGFDCSKAQKQFERIICQSYELSRIDSEYGRLFRLVRPNGKGSPAQKEAVRIQNVLTACLSSDCVRAGLVEGHDRMAGFVKAQGGQATTFAEINEARRREQEQIARAAAEKREAEIARVKAEAAKAEEERARVEAQKLALKSEAEERAKAEAAKAEESKRKWLVGVDKLGDPQVAQLVTQCESGPYQKARLGEAATLGDRSRIRQAVVAECRCMAAETASDQGASNPYAHLVSSGEITAQTRELLALTMKQCRANVPAETLAGWSKTE